MALDLYIIAGEHSGDIRGSEVVKQLQVLRPSLTIHGVAGPHLRSLGVTSNYPTESLQVMGFFDVVKALPTLIRTFGRVKREILALQPKAVLFIDYPGFNIRLARAVRKAGFQNTLIQYICPTVWAWGKGRIRHMENTLDALLTILPFEPECFSKTALDVSYVGHPLTQTMASLKETKQPSDRIALFPGSRTKEISMNLPLQIAAARKSGRPYVISCAQEKMRPALEALNIDRVPIIPPERTHQLMHSIDAAIATSGTVCLELALLNVPTVCTYAIRPLDLFLAQKIFRINLPYYCIVNIICSEELIPELFGPHLTEHNLDEALKKVLSRPERHIATKLQNTLGQSDAARNAAEKIARLL